jgi:hypothetical protein
MEHISSGKVVYLVTFVPPMLNNIAPKSAFFSHWNVFSSQNCVVKVV